MAENKRTYQIVINGIEQSIAQVDALSDAVQFLDKQLKAIQERNIQVNSSYNGSSSSNNSVRIEEDKLLKQIQDTERQIIDARREDYQSLLASKDVLKEVTDAAKQRAAAERLVNNQYKNTMQSMKQELKDIETVMQTTDIGSQKFQDMTKRANELNAKLKEIKTSCEQFGRNVGNYPQGMSEEFKKLTIEVNGVTREFNSAMEALRTLTNERNTLSLMGEDVGELDKVVKTLKSDIKDMDKSSKTMDGLLDTMEGILALASTAEGISSLFGLDNSAIEESIRKLVALQNVIQGIEVIRKQIQTSQGIVGLITKGWSTVDSFVNSLFNLGKAAKQASVASSAVSTASSAVSTSLSSVTTSSKTATVGLTTTSTAANTAAKSFTLTTLAATALKVVLMSLGIGLVVAAVTALITAITELINKETEAEKEAKKIKDIEDETNKVRAREIATLETFLSRLKNFNGTRAQEKQLLGEINDKYGERIGKSKTLAEAQEKLITLGKEYVEVLALEAKAQALFNQYVKDLEHVSEVERKADNGEYNSVLRSDSGNKRFAQNRINEAKQQANRTKVLLDNTNKEILEKSSKFTKKYTTETTNNIKSSGAKIGKTVQEVEEDIAKLRVEAMRNGLVKTLAQIALDRNKRIEEVKKSGHLINEQIALINKIYEDKIFDARSAFYQKLLKEQEKYGDKLLAKEKEINDKHYDNSKKLNEVSLEEAIFNLTNAPTEPIEQTEEAMEKYYEDLEKWEKRIAKLTLDTNMFSLDIPKVISRYKELSDELNRVNINMENLDTSTEEGQKAFDEYSDKANELTNELQELGDKYPNIDKIADRLIGSTWGEMLDNRRIAVKEYYDNVRDLTLQYLDKAFNTEKEKINDETALLEKAENKRHDAMVSLMYNTEIPNSERFSLPQRLLKGFNDNIDNLISENRTEDEIGRFFSLYQEEMNKWLDELKSGVEEGKYTWEEYNNIMNSSAIQGYLTARNEYKSFLEYYNSLSKKEQDVQKSNLNKYIDNMNVAYVQYLNNVERETDIHNNAMSVIQKEGLAKQKVNEKTFTKEKQKTNHEDNLKTIDEFETTLSTISSKMQSLRAKTSNSWILFNYKDAKNELKEMKTSISSVFQEMRVEKMKLSTQLSEGLISQEDYKTAMERLNNIVANLAELNNEVEHVDDSLLEDLWKTFNTWLQAIGQSANSIIGSLSEIQNNHYDKLIRETEDYIDKLEEEYSRQEEIERQHADNVDSIEDELATARGDRRQQLIDQLNAEMAAQREALAQEKKIQKEKEAEEKRLKKLEHDQAVAKKKMQRAQAYINTALAISAAATNDWPIPAIPLMALAAATGAAQIAAIESQDIPSYGSGGQLQGGVAVGNRHRDGGIKVLGGRAEIEGGEYVVNRESTSKNLGLLDYVNRSDRKLSLDDLMAFYSSNGRVARNISSQKTKFADGGMIPSLASENIDFNDRLIDAIERYSERPQVVSVVDIIDRTAAVREVQVLSGLNDDQ